MTDFLQRSFSIGSVHIHHQVYGIFVMLAAAVGEFTYRPDEPWMQILAAAFEKQRQEPAATHGTLSIYHGDTKVGETEIKTQMGFFAIAGSSLYVGRHAGDALTDDYPGEPPYAFTGGTIHQVTVNVSGQPYTDLEHHAAMLLKHQ